MNPRYVRLRPDMTVDEAIAYLRRAARERVETIYYVYVLDAEQRLLGVVSFRDLFAAQPDARVREVMRSNVISVRDDIDQEAVAHVIAEHNLMAVPVRRRRGQDARHRHRRRHRRRGARRGHRGHPEDRRYRRRSMRPTSRSASLEMVRKRGGWLAVLFVGEMLTATAMSLLRGRDRARRGARAVHPADHLERRQLGLAGDARS